MRVVVLDLLLLDELFIGFEIFNDTVIGFTEFKFRDVFGDDV